MGALKLSEERRYQLIDKLLDSYNHNMQLYHIYGENQYKERADIFMETLKYYFSNDQ
jgi:hypothetical protein